MRTFAVAMALFAALILAACGGAAPTPAPTPLPTPTQAPAPTPAPLDLPGAELLGAPGIVINCDHGADAEITCQTTDEGQRINVRSAASTYARWSLRSTAIRTPLSGNETLTLRIRRSGQAAPNLYVVEQSGKRILVPLTRYGLADTWRTLHIPLREVKDDAGDRLDFSQVAEIQIVFEWSDMEGSVEIAGLQFVTVWEEPVTISETTGQLAQGLNLPAGFAAIPLADNLRELTQIEFTPAGDMLVSLQGGRIWRLVDQNGDGSYDTRQLYDSGYTEVVGLLSDPQDGAVWIGGRGQLYRTLDSDGDGAADLRELRIDGLAWGRHQNNGLEWNPDPDPFTGEAGNSWIYFGLGSTGDLETGEALNATVLRFPRDGHSLDDLETVSYGNRNTYDLVWAPVPVDLAVPDGPAAWQLFASENGPDFNDAPDEVNHIRWQHHYGFPNHFGPVEPATREGVPFSSPVYDVTAHASADGIAYVTNPAWPAEYRTLYVALFGEVFSPDPVGHIVERVTLEEIETPTGEKSYRGVPSTFIAGLDRPLPLTVAPNGDLVVGDYATGVIYAIAYTP